MSTYYALCRGADIRLCNTCRRHENFNVDAAQDPHQAWVPPHNQDERCPSWMPKPSKNPPAINTGD